jgi:hypothetical protein
MYKIRGLASVLVELPVHATIPVTQLAAGPPFEMPYTLAIPQREIDRWRWLRDMLVASHRILADLGTLDGDAGRLAFAAAIADGDRALMRRLDLIIAGLESPLPSSSRSSGGRV